MNRGLTLPRTGLILAAAGLMALGGIATGRAVTGLPDGKENTNVIVQNAGTSAADIVMDIYTPAGVPVPSASRPASGIAPGGTAQFPQATNNGLTAGFRGVGVLSANQPINALLVRDILASRSTNAKSYSLANATSTGGHKLAAPIMFNQLQSGGRWWNSRASVVNVGTSTACVRVTYTLLPNKGGATGTTSSTVVDNGPGCSGGQGYVLEPGAQLTFSAEPGDTAYPAGTFNNQMTAVFQVVNASASNKIAAVIDVYRSDSTRGLGSYNALVQDDAAASSDDVGTRVIAPIALKTRSGFYTVTGVVNVSTTAATASIQYIGNLGDGTGAPFSLTIPLGSIPPSEGVEHSTYLANAASMPFEFVGYAIVTSDQPVAVTVIRGKETSAGSGTTEPIYAAVNGVPDDRASTTWRTSLYFRRFAPGPSPSVGYNSWVQVQVADGTSATVTLRYVGDPTSGCPVGPYEVTTTVNNSKVFYANLDASPDNGFPSGAPNCFFGGLQVTANKPVIVISQVGADKFPGGDSEGLANAFPG